MDAFSILVADASREDRWQVVEAFQRAREDADFVETADGPSTLDALRSRSFDLVLLSRTLPRFDGRAFMEWSRDNRHTSVFALLTDRLAEGWPRIATQIHAYDVLLKPYRDEVAAKLIAACERMRTPSKALLVSGSPQMLVVATKLMEQSRFALEVTQSDSAGFAIKAITLERFDVALVSMTLPGTTGLEAVVQMKAKSPDTRFVLMGTAPEDAIAGGLRRLGVSAYLRMPFELSDVDGALHDALGLWRPYLLNALRNRPVRPLPAAAEPAGGAAPAVTGGSVKAETIVTTVSAPATGPAQDPNSILFDLCYADGATARLRVDRAELRGGDHLLGAIIRNRQAAGRIPAGSITEVKKLVTSVLLG